MKPATPRLLPVHGGQLRQIAAHYGIPEEGLLDFSANINPAGPPLSALNAIRKALENSSFLAQYPDLELIELKQAIASNLGVAPDNVAVANGFVPLLEAALRSLKIQRCLLPVPAFSEYRGSLENAGVAVIPYPLSQDAGFEYDIDSLLETLLANSCDAILLANPQNPSGVGCDAGRALRLIEMASRHEITVLLDEAFIDYCVTDTLSNKSIELTNVIVFRSVTKFFACPGLRVAYAVSNFSMIEGMNRLIARWPISSIASCAVCAALEDEPFASDSRLANERRRLWLQQELTQLKIATYRSTTNFLLLRFPPAIDAGLLWEKMIIDQQIVLRSCANFEGMPEGHLRIAVRSEPENERLIRGLKQALASLSG